MTIFVKVTLSAKNDEWYYWYDDQFNMLTTKRVSRQLPLSTLQGAYSLIIKQDATQIVSHFEAICAAEITHWRVVPKLEVPKADSGQILVVRDVDDGQKQAYFTNRDYTVFYMRMGEPIEPANLTHVAIGEQLIVDITPDGRLVGVWMLDLPPEIAEKHAGKPSA